MTQFDRIFAHAARLPLAVFGEPLTYVPFNGPQRSIERAIIQRTFPEPLDGAPQQHSPVITIEVANDSDCGIEITEIDVGGDQVIVSERVGGPTALRYIKTVNPSRRGFTEFEVR